MPGDFSPPSRFVRAAIYSQSAAPNATAEDAVLSAFHILNQFDIPKGSVQNSAIGGTVDEITEWTSVADLKNLRWYFRTFSDQSIHMVDLKEAVEPPRARCASSRWKERRNPSPTPRRISWRGSRQEAQSPAGLRPAGRLLVLKPTGRPCASGPTSRASNSTPDRAALPRQRRSPARHSLRRGSGPKRIALARRPKLRSPAGPNLQARARRREVN